MQLIFRVAFDCIPPRRCDVLQALMEGKSPFALNLPNAVVERAVEDLQAVGLVTKPKGKAALSDLAIGLLAAAKLQGAEVASPQFPLESGGGKGQVSDFAF
jgi:hypothetical protein